MAVIGVIAQGMMGAGVGRRLHESGAEVRTLLTGRSQASVERAKKAGMAAAADPAAAARRDGPGPPGPGPSRRQPGTRQPRRRARNKTTPTTTRQTRKRARADVGDSPAGLRGQ